MKKRIERCVAVLAVLCVFGMLPGCKVAQEVCASNDNLGFDSHGACVNFIASGPARVLCAGSADYGQCVSDHHND